MGHSTFLAIICALPALEMLSCDPLPSLHILARSPKTAFWVWSNLLPFAIDNQRQSSSIDEDQINKPWRPMPSKRVSVGQATKLMIVFYTSAFSISTCLGGCTQCLILMGLGYWYNDMNGGDNYCLVRNFINACGYTCFISGALEVILERSIFAFPVPVYQWLAIISMVILTTIQAQDMGDQDGDNLRGRWTVPLVIGDVSARYTIASFVLLWSYVCVAFWELQISALVASLAFGTAVGYRFLFHRAKAEDHVSFRIYNLWIAFIFSLPLLKIFL